MLNVIKGVQKKPWRMMIYGQPGVGKSTFAAGAPKPLFIDVERRTEHLDIPRLQPDSWETVLSVIKELVSNTSEYKTVVFDTVDHLEHLVFTYLTKKFGVQSIEDVAGGYGKGYTMALEEWRRFAVGLEALRDKGYNILLLGHGHVKTFNNPTGENYDRWIIKINQKAADFLKEKVDAVGFAHYDDGTKKGKGDLKAKAVGSDDRVLTFLHNPAFESKRGLGLPDEVELKFSELKGLV